jgi:alcohol dehydrogenase class IV
MVFYAVQFPKRVVFGDAVEGTIGDEAKGLGAKNVFVVTDETIEKAGLIEKVAKPLKAAAEVEVYAKVTSEPTLAAAEAVAMAARATKFDLVVGVGGGSVLDMAKVAAAAVANPWQPVKEFLGANKIVNPSVSKIFIPTTAGTGAEATPYALVIVEGKKKAIASPYNLAEVIMFSPSFTATMPPEVTASTGMDALSHAVEAFLSRGANPLTDSFAIEAIRKISDNLEEVFSHGANLSARLEMSLAAMLAGLAFGNAGVIAGHAAAHTFGARYAIPHGVASALALPHVMSFNAQDPTTQERLALIAREMGEDVTRLTQEKAALKAVERVESLLETLKLPLRLADLNVPEDDVPGLAEALLAEKGYLARNPRKVEQEEAKELIARMWRGK